MKKFSCLIHILLVWDGLSVRENERSRKLKQSNLFRLTSSIYSSADLPALACEGDWCKKSQSSQHLQIVCKAVLCLFWGFDSRSARDLKLWELYEIAWLKQTVCHTKPPRLRDSAAPPSERTSKHDQRAVHKATRVCGSNQLVIDNEIIHAGNTSSTSSAQMLKCDEKSKLELSESCRCCLWSTPALNKALAPRPKVAWVSHPGHASNLTNCRRALF